jgi:hypothetical protein
LSFLADFHTAAVSLVLTMSGYAEKDVVAAEAVSNIQLPEKVTTNLHDEKLPTHDAEQSPSSISSAQRSPRASVDKVAAGATPDQNDDADNEKKKQNAGLGHYFVRTYRMNVPSLETEILRATHS